MTDPEHRRRDDRQAHDSSADVETTPAEESDDTDPSEGGPSDGDEGWVPM